jgi:EAL domain-containing protein (putative c-di-GMP-specific phosphodiesterase class I)
VVELTEHQSITPSRLLAHRLETLRGAGVRIAVDDAGSGYAGLERILHLRPEVLKLDRVLVQGVAQHAGRRAMCEAMVQFTRRTGAALVAEGVEEEPDLEVLRRLGVDFAQGYLLGLPTIW